MADAMDMERINALTHKVIGAAIRVHEELGPGLLECVYLRCMVIELRHQRLPAEWEVPVQIVYRGEVVAEEGFRMDLVVDGTLVVELKSVEDVKPVHKKQLLTYLRLAGKPIGLLINFNEVLLKDGIARIIDTRDQEQ
ncbi:MAG: GxxExxY protein [Planctomycetota bacterium]